MTEQKPPFDPAPYEIYKIDPTTELIDNPVLITIRNVVIATLMNFTLWIGKAKSRKTFIITALTAAAASGSCSIEGIKGMVRAANKILYFDTEQSPFHAQRTVKRICRQIGIDQPSNLFAYGLRPITPKERLQFIEHKINNTPGLALVVIDGIADLLSKGINDEPEAIEMLTMLMKWSENLNIHIVVVLHMNKGDFNARGVIGSYLMQKAESTISINKNPKDRNISIVHADYCRDMDFEDFAFTINEEGLPVLADAPQAEKPGRVDQKILFEEILKDGRIMSHTLLCTEIIQREGKSKSTANGWIKYWKNNGLLSFDEQKKGYKLLQSLDYETPF